MFDFNLVNKFCSLCRVIRGCVPDCPLQVFIQASLLAKKKNLSFKEAVKLSFRTKRNDKAIK